tara:strand:- start:348 stop:1724 length:1377 start_codon:yes stop_codon:yes gene_type:complete
MIFSAVRNAARGAMATVIVYPLTERYEARDIRSKMKWVRKEIDLPVAARRARAVARLAQTVRFAGATVPYYRDLFVSIGFDPDKIDADIRYLEDLPYLTKDIIREQGDRLLNENRGEERIHIARTGGSTGPSAEIHYDQAAADWSSAITRESRRRIGNTHWRSELHFASSFPEVFPWRDRLREQIKCLAMNRDNIFFEDFSSAEFERIWRKIKTIRPHLVHAHPSTVDQLAAHVEKTRSSDKGFAVFESTGELLQTSQRDRIERVLKCRVINRYGLAEAGVVAYQLEQDNTDMSFHDFFAWPELRPDAETGLDNVPDGADSGELVITPLFNRLMPLLRYRTGDNVVLSSGPNGFAIPRMIGRVHDVVMLAGKPLPTHYIQDVLDRVGGIREFQIQMRNDKPVFRLVPEDGADTSAIKERIASWWADAVDVEFIALDALIRVGARQKFRHVVPEKVASL